MRIMNPGKHYDPKLENSMGCLPVYRVEPAGLFWFGPVGLALRDIEKRPYPPNDSLVPARLHRLPGPHPMD